ncbi:hypothetical protein SAMN05880593_107110 [Rhizobium sp. RU36D]|nr:hypothetical protein SAMN05880593_107110 [Rhizobium sp. RU36D]
MFPGDLLIFIEGRVTNAIFRGDAVPPHQGQEIIAVYHPCHSFAGSEARKDI